MRPSAVQWNLLGIWAVCSVVSSSAISQGVRIVNGTDYEKRTPVAAFLPLPQVIPKVPTPNGPKAVPAPAPILRQPGDEVVPPPAAAPPKAGGDAAPPVAPKAGGDAAPAAGPKPQPATAIEDGEERVIICKRAGVCSPEDAAAAKVAGQRVTKQLDDTIAAGRPDTGSQASIESKYERTQQAPDKEGISLFDYFSEGQFGTATELSAWTRTIVRNKEGERLTLAEARSDDAVIGSSNKPNKIDDEKQDDGKDKGDWTIILDTYSSFEEGKPNAVLVSQSYNKRRDALIRKPDGKPPPIRWSEMMMDNIRVASNNRPSELEWIFRDNIKAGTETEMIAATALKEVGQTGSGNFRFAKDSTGAEKNGYDMLASSVHVDRVMRMLADHHNEMGNLKVIAIYTAKEDIGVSLALQLGK